jgi:2-C-methyl-D-erythritol 2,4-cyclodiphosphate synthase
MNRIGFGFDSHRFEVGRPLMLCGVRVEHPRGLAGHSDADAALHAVIDAMLGAAGLGDIGEHFPDTDAKWKNADSAALLTETVGMLGQMGWEVSNCDLTIVAQEPKLAGVKPAMRDRLADLLGMDPSGVNVKAKTAEGMGLIGAGEGLAVYAVVMLEETQE